MISGWETIFVIIPLTQVFLGNGRGGGIPATMEPLPTLATAQKLISVFPGWSPPEPETNYIWFDAPLEIAGVTLPGFVLHGGCYIDKPECGVVFEMRARRIPARRCIPLARVEWRSLKGGHTNPRRGDAEWSGARVGPTHYHPFALNWLPDKGRMRAGNLRVAVDINEDLQIL